MDNSNLRQEIEKYLKSHKQFALATYGDHPWIATMYYGVDDDLNIYFLTSPDTIHAQGVYKKSEVAAVIADSPQDPKSKKVGMQIYGIAKELEGEKEIKDGFKVWCGALDVTDPKYSYEGIKSGDLHHRLYIVNPKKIKYYNENLFEEGDEQTLELF